MSLTCAPGEDSARSAGVDYAQGRYRQCKREEFAHEKEVRFVLDFTCDEGAAIEMHLRIAEDLAWRSIGLSAVGVGAGLVYGLGGIAVQDDTAVEGATPYGIHVPLDFASYIEGVYLCRRASRVLRYAVRDVLQSFGVDLSLMQESRSDKIPPDRLKIRPEPPGGGAA